MQKILTKEGLVVYDKDIPATIRLDPTETNALLHKTIDYKKLDNHCEIVHLEISDQCNLSCKYCYNEKHSYELTTEQWEDIIDSLVDYGVFQITFGGGEPLMRRDWHVLLLYAVGMGLNVGMTTNGVFLHEINPRYLKYFRQVNVSYHGELDVLKKALKYLYDNGVKSGINFVVRKEYFSALENILAVAKQYDSEVLLLTYKPVIDDFEQVIEPRKIYELAKFYSEFGHKIAIDGLSCYGSMQEYCLQKKTFCDIDSLGNVYPCSFIRKSIGNILEQDFKEIWRKRGEQERCPFLNKNEC